jgi:hypothetical protein
MFESANGAGKAAAQPHGARRLVKRAAETLDRTPPICTLAADRKR